ncbi:MAG: helix-turn-helix domain-containing protein [Prevotellaceae bacterium]|jgi:transcriptional regulator with XRE-family HTH domain|nr:helix-turn-helix domain-containing protein [Prevotellaceae bacterium]
MNNRIFELIDKLHLTNQQFAQQTGISPARLTQLKSGNSTLSIELIDRILETYKTVSREWLYFGEGTMFGKISNSQGGNLFGFDDENPSKSDSFVPKNEQKNVSENFENRNLETKKPYFIENSEKITHEPQTVIEIREKIIEKPIEKKIIRITVFYEDGSFKELFTKE